MKKTWMYLGAAGLTAASLLLLRPGRAHEQPTAPSEVRVAGAPVAPGVHRRAIPRAVAWRSVEVNPQLAPREREPLEALDTDVSELTTAEVDAELDALIGDAQSYWELSTEARAQYDQLEAQRLARLGLPPVEERLEPWHEVMTLDGKPLDAEVTP